MPEIEAKFLIRQPEQVADVLATLGALGYEITEGETRTHVDSYFDTPDWAIYRAGWAYRCRLSGGQSQLTLKSLAEPDGLLFRREEIEQPLSADRLPNALQLPPGPVQERLASIGNGAERRKLFSVKSRRTAYLIRTPDNDSLRIEMDLDRTRIRAQSPAIDAPGTLEFTEVELELKSGDPSVLAQLAASLRERSGLIPAQLSKFERGLHTTGLHTAGHLADSRAVKLANEDPALDLLYAYLREQLEVMQIQQPVAWEGLDPEGVHKMRVAVRKTRALVKTFRSLISADFDTSVEAELRWLAGELGEARDADICEQEVSRALHSLPAGPRDAAQPFSEHLRQLRTDAYANLAEAFASVRCKQLMSKLEALIRGGPGAATRNAFGTLSVADCSGQLVASNTKKVLKLGKRITRKSSAAELHRLRIRAKQLRYLLDFFSSVQLTAWQKILAAMQKLHDILGDHQDAVTGRQRLSDYVDALPPGEVSRDLLLALGRLQQNEDGRIASCRRRLPAAWSRFRKTLA